VPYGPATSEPGIKLARTGQTGHRATTAAIGRTTTNHGGDRRSRVVGLGDNSVAWLVARRIRDSWGFGLSLMGQVLLRNACDKPGWKRYRAPEAGAQVRILPGAPRLTSTRSPLASANTARGLRRVSGCARPDPAIIGRL
jgi:hypothetical protein